MSFKISKDQLKKLLEEYSRKVADNSYLQLVGERKRLIVLDIIERSLIRKPMPNMDVLVLDGSDMKILTYYPSIDEVETVQNIVARINSGGVVEVEAYVSGNRIMSITSYRNVYELPEDVNDRVVVGVVRRTATGKVLLDSVDGKTYLISDISIKGRLLCGKAVDGMKIVVLGYVIQGRTGIDVIRMLHWQELTEEESETTVEEQMEAKTESEENEQEKITELSAEPSQAESKTESSIEDSSIMEKAQYVANVLMDKRLYDVLREIMGDLGNQLAETISKTALSLNEEELAKCARESISDILICLVDKANLSKVMKALIVKKIEENRDKIDTIFQKTEIENRQVAES